jgi:hypothetical protein
MTAILVGAMLYCRRHRRCDGNCHHLTLALVIRQKWFNLLDLDGSGEVSVNELEVSDPIVFKIMSIGMLVCAPHIMYNRPPRNV